ncbi:unnamed protein product [Brugia pahangi]|uniref:Uncharacterized protein n=1 Tax=Brugia pahangi TaxID=6280 RepID=A0A0N4TLV7_BRUPA|nr:unnamed protein product [Brugia pahangi]
MPSKSVSASMTTMPSTSGSTELTASSQHKKAQVIFLQRSPKLIISRNGSEAVQHFILTQQPINATKFLLLKRKMKAKLAWVEISFFLSEFFNFLNFEFF